jgi:hypothetical protein
MDGDGRVRADEKRDTDATRANMRNLVRITRLPLLP